MDKIQTIEKLFYFVVVYSYLILPLLYLFQSIKKRELITLAIYGVLFFILLSIYDFLPSRNWRILYICLYTYIEYSIFAYLISLSINSKTFKRIILFASIAFLIFQTLFYLFADFKRLDSIPVGIETILIIVYTAFYFYHHFKISTDRYIYSLPSFWVIIGILLYLGFTFFFNILVNHVDDKLKEAWYLTYLPEILKNVFFALSMLMLTKETTKTSGSNEKKVPFLDMI